MQALWDNHDIVCELLKATSLPSSSVHYGIDGGDRRSNGVTNLFHDQMQWQWADWTLKRPPCGMACYLVLYQ